MESGRFLEVSMLLRQETDVRRGFIVVLDDVDLA